MNGNDWVVEMIVITPDEFVESAHKYLSDCESAIKEAESDEARRDYQCFAAGAANAILYIALKNLPMEDISRITKGTMWKPYWGDAGYVPEFMQ